MSDELITPTAGAPAITPHPRTVPPPRRFTGQWGQATAEYALVVLGAAAVAALVLAWAAGTGKISTLLNAVVDSVIGRLT
jgi:hypothetical protein